MDVFVVEDSAIVRQRLILIQEAAGGCCRGARTTNVTLTRRDHYDRLRRA